MHNPLIAATEQADWTEVDTKPLLVNQMLFCSYVNLAERAESSL